MSFPCTALQLAAGLALATVTAAAGAVRGAGATCNQVWTLRGDEGVNACSGGLACRTLDGFDQCATALAEGDACPAGDVYDACDAGLYCYAGKCVTAKNIGEDCDNYSACGKVSYCVKIVDGGAQCSDFLAEGMTCYVDSPFSCQNGLTCRDIGAGPVCLSRSDKTEACNYEYDWFVAHSLSLVRRGLLPYLCRRYEGHILLHYFGQPLTFRSIPIIPGSLTGLACIDGTCTDLVELGGACKYSDQCVDDLACSSASYRCTTRADLSGDAPTQAPTATEGRDPKSPQAGAKGGVNVAAVAGGAAGGVGLLAVLAIFCGCFALRRRRAGNNGKNNETPIVDEAAPSGVGSPGQTQSEDAAVSWVDAMGLR
jgi:hypothetical protein